MTESEDLQDGGLPAPSAQADPVEELARLRRRAARNLRKARAEGFLAGICAMLRPGDLVFDCGANAGDITALLAATGAEVWAFEPDPYSSARLAERFADTPNVVLHPVAVGAAAGTVQLMRAANWASNPDAASVKSTVIAGGRAIDESQGLAVPMVDLPALIETERDRGRSVAFIKLDVEGAELDILEAMDARGTFDAVGCLVAETHERKFRDLRPRYRELRRRLSEAWPGGRINLDWI